MGETFRHPSPRAAIARVLPALIVAVVALPFLGGPVAAASSSYVANCPVNLRTSTSTSASVVDVISAGSVVTVSSTVAGGSWSADCGGTVSGSSWFAITAVGGKTTTSLYGRATVYAASGLFHLAPPPSPMLEGVDVSKWQGAIDFSKVYGAGKRFVIAKASEGIGYADPSWTTNRANATANGLKVTGYHFARPDLNPTNAVGEADWFVSQLKLAPGMLVPALDLEVAGTMTPSALTNWVEAWLNEVYVKTGARPMIYTSPSFWSNKLANTAKFANEGYTVLWIAHWFVNQPTVPAGNWGGHGWTFWQYDDSGSVPGIGGAVDLDRYNGLDMTTVTFGASFAVASTPTSQSVKQGGSTSFTVAINRQFFTLPVSLSVTGAPAGATATLSAASTTGSSVTLTVKTSKSGTITPLGSYPLTITATGNGLTRTTTATVAVTDGIGPVAASPTTRLYGVTTVSATTPVRSAWSATDPSGISAYALQWQYDGGSWSSQALSPVSSTGALTGVSFGHHYRTRVAATDGAGNVGAWAYGRTFTPYLLQQTSTAIAYHGTWTTASTTYASGGSLRYATASGASATYTFSGSAISWVSYLGPNRGSAKVYIDGVYRTTVSLYSSTYQNRKVVYASNWGSNGTHTIRIVVVGTAGHPRVDLDAFVRTVLS